MAQQTAVELIEDGIKAREKHWQTEYQQGYQRALSDMIMYIKEAKEMEKQQRITDYNIGYQDGQCNHINDAENYIYESNTRI